MTEEEWLANRERVAESRRRRRAALRAKREMEICPTCGGYKWHSMIDPIVTLDDDERCDCGRD